MNVLRGGCCALLLWNLSGCTFLAPIHSGHRQSNVERFREHVKNRELIPAGRFARFYELATPPDTAETLIQYYLLTCQPRKAFERIKKINSERRPFFEAALFTLISVPRPKPTVPPTIGKEKKPGSKVPPIVWKTNEVWADEWPHVNVSSHCPSMPLVADQKLRDRIKQEALKRFQSVPEEWITRDFKIMSLAMDVGFKFSDAAALLKQHEEFSDNPYFQILSQQAASIREEILSVKSQKQTEINLSELSLVEQEINAHELEIPILLE